MQTLRFAPEVVARRYCLPVGGPVSWQSTTDGYATEITLPDLAADDIVVPSITVDADGYGHQFSLMTDARNTLLAPIGMTACSPSAGHPSTDTGPVKSQLDYFSVDEEIHGAGLRLRISGLTRAPEHYLLTISVRPRVITPRIGVLTSRRLLVPPVSQMTAPRAIRRRICSPACVTMAARFLGAGATLARATRDCLHAPTGIYGVWPLALRAMGRFGILGSVEALSDIDSVAPFLDRGVPAIASIRFEPGELPGATLQRTSGHLVLITGIDSTHVHVNDPAATNPVDVVCSYPREAFARAWLRERGATYLFCAPIFSAIDAPQP